MKHYLPLIALLTLVSTPFIPTPVIAEETQLVASEIEPEIKEYARSISVQVTTDNQNYGSGVIIGIQGNKYLVITNHHVVRDGEAFAIETADGASHDASIVPNSITSDDDIALLSFNSSNEYEAVKLNGANTGKEEKQIYAVGYSADTGEFLVESGKIERIPDRPFKEGYQIGYSSDIVSGMSGGAIFDDFGDLVGINGIGAFPILNTPYQYEDETTPATADIEQFRSLSWGLSVHRLLTQLNQDIITAYSLPLPKTAAEVPQTELTGWLGDLEAKAKQITVRIDSSSGANGSGVIIAKEGNTYTVLTADHVLCEKDEDTNECIEHTYEIITPDGEKYPLDINTINAQPGVDLAVFEFVSNKTYQVAELADYPVQDNDAIFVAGYPKLASNTTPQWKFSLGYGFEKETGLLSVNISSNNQSSDGSDLAASQSISTSAYEMVYTSPTYGGMSGGAVLDREGRVVGIHGLAEGETAVNSQGGTEKEQKIQLGLSLGIPIKTFIGLKERLKIGSTLSIQSNQPQTLNSDNRKDITTAILGTEISDSNATPERLLERGNNLWRLRRYEEAERVFDRVIDLKPDFMHLAYYGKGLALAYQQKYQTALASLEQASFVQPDFAIAFEAKSNLLKELGRWNEALIAINNAIEILPQNANWFDEKGRILSKLERYEEAELAHSKAIILDPMRSTFYSNRGVLYTERGEIESALTDYNQALNINPQNADAYSNRGVIYTKQGKLNLALADYNQALKINPRYALAYSNRGALHAERGEIESALTDYNQALKINPQLDRAYYNRGGFYQKQKEIELAFADYNKAIKINPQYADAYSNRGVLHAERGEIESALTDYNQALKINPQLAETYNNRGNLYSDAQEEIELALTDYNKAIKINPQYADAYYNRGSLYMERGELNLALADYNQAIKINPRYAAAYNNRGIIYAERGESNLALADYNKAIEINPQYAEAYGNSSLLYIKIGDKKAAIANLQKAQQLFIDQDNYVGVEHTANMLKTLE